MLQKELPTALLNAFLHPGAFYRKQDIVPVKLNQETLLLSPLAVFRATLQLSAGAGGGWDW